MRRFFQLVIAAMAMCIWPGMASASFNVCNKTGSELSLATAWNNVNGWNVQGWFNLSPGECQNIVGETLVNRYIYYYAEGHGLTYASNDNSGFFCADHNQKFYYTYDLDSIKDCEGYAFSMIDIGDDPVDEYELSLTEDATDPTTAAMNCSDKIGVGRDAFVSCWIGQVATARQKEILNCMQSTSDPAALAICASKGGMGVREKSAAQCASQYVRTKTTAEFVGCMANGQLDEKSSAIINCAINNRGSYGSMSACAAGSMLTSEQKKLYGCIADNFNNYLQAATCAVGGRMSSDQRRIFDCVTKNTASFMQMGVCAAAGNKLTPEQQAFTQCAITTGGQPYAFAGCVGTQLTLNELNKCLSVGIGGNGCFGHNNTAVRLVTNAWNDVTKGPGKGNEIVKGREAILGRDRGTVANIIRDPIRCGLFLRKC